MWQSWGEAGGAKLDLAGKACAEGDELGRAGPGKGSAAVGGAKAVMAGLRLAEQVGLGLENG